MFNPEGETVWIPVQPTVCPYCGGTVVSITYPATMDNAEEYDIECRDCGADNTIETDHDHFWLWEVPLSDLISLDMAYRAIAHYQNPDTWDVAEIDDISPPSDPFTINCPDCRGSGVSEYPRDALAFGMGYCGTRCRRCRGAGTLSVVQTSPVDPDYHKEEPNHAIDVERPDPKDDNAATVGRRYRDPLAAFRPSGNPGTRPN